ncbi:hypothetical protein GMJLKIPL_6128 [Methylobacterium isbiliense]|uniref:HTH cro/C1-type domain-containing protein n=2 Tax=Methylobacterium isbiliense TaxID=315478 RepID=A0ABQ4SM24_9HYPH|nr:hypothetical protein GMJLKIPL_6128 [Methylobacterium isbiliense]
MPGSLPPLGRMRKAIHSARQAHLLALLRRERKAAGLNQTALAERLGRPQSFVAKVEGGERRLDLLEFIELCGALGCDPVALFAELAHFEPA